MLPETVADIPREIEGIDKVGILIIDDGSTDPHGRRGPRSRRRPHYLATAQLIWRSRNRPSDDFAPVTRLER